MRPKCFWVAVVIHCLSLRVMGASFTNLQVRNATAKIISALLQKLTDSRAYVSPEHNGWVTVYPEVTEDQNDETLRALASGLSLSLKTDVIGFLVHDSDIAAYWLYRSGVLADEFDSDPDCLGRSPDNKTRQRVRGSVEALLPLCVVGTTHDQIEAVIHPADGFPLMAEEILTELARLLGIDDTRVSLGFTYFDDEGEEILPDAGEFEPVGRDTERKEKRSHGVVQPPPAAIPDMFPLAIGMLTKCWDRKQEQQMAVFQEMFAATGQKSPGLDKMLKQLRDGFDRAARDFLKQSLLPGRPTIEELKAARDRGPEELAKLLAERTPAMLADIGETAVREELEEFVVALLAAGMNPNAKDFHGRTVLSAGEKLGPDSRICEMLKAAAAKKH